MQQANQTGDKGRNNEINTRGTKKTQVWQIERRVAKGGGHSPRAEGGIKKKGDWESKAMKRMKWS